MSYDTIATEIAKRYREAVAAGVDPCTAHEVLMRAEAELVAMEIEHQRLFVDLVKHCGTAAIAERRGISQQAVRAKFVKALNKIASKIAA